MNLERQQQAAVERFQSLSGNLDGTAEQMDWEQELDQLRFNPFQGIWMVPLEKYWQWRSKANRFQSLSGNLDGTATQPRSNPLSATGGFNPFQGIWMVPPGACKL